MLDRLQGVDRFVADALRGAVGRDEFGVRGFQLAQPLDQPVVFEVRDLGRGLDVVLPVVAPDLLAQPLDLGLDVL